METTKGTLQSQSYAGGSIETETVRLSIQSLTIGGGKVTRASGQVVDPQGGQQIGTFQYQDGESYPGAGDTWYRCNVEITSAQHAQLQTDATEALLQGLGLMKNEE